MLRMITVCPEIQALMKNSSRGSRTTVVLFSREAREQKFTSFIIFQWQLAHNSHRLFENLSQRVLTFMTRHKMRRLTICYKIYGFSSFLPQAQWKGKNTAALAICNHWYCYQHPPPPKYALFLHNQKNLMKSWWKSSFSVIYAIPFCCFFFGRGTHSPSNPVVANDGQRSVLPAPVLHTGWTGKRNMWHIAVSNPYHFEQEKQAC